MSCDHEYVYANADTFAPRRCRLCGHVPCAHVWADAADGVPVCRTCGQRAHWSPSALETAEDCPRKSGYRSLGAQPDRENPYAAFGKRAHKIRENYLKLGIWNLEIARTPEGKCVEAGIPFWPMPIPRGGNVIGVELKFEHDVMGVPAVRLIDSVSNWNPGVYARADDLKTITRVGAAHQKTEATLREDPQRILYAFDVAEWLGVDTVGAQWTYCQRKPPKAEPVEFEESRSITRERMGDVIIPRARAMVRLRLLPLEELPRNRDACGKYGAPCEYASHCLRDVDVLDDLKHALYTLDADGYTSADREGTPMTDPTALPSLGDLVKGAAANGTAPAPTTLPPMPGAVPPPAPAPAPAPTMTPTTTLVLIPELASWVEQCKAGGHDTREQAAAGMVQRGAWTREQAATFVEATTPAVIPPAPAPVVAPPATNEEVRAQVEAQTETLPTTPPAEGPTSTPPKRGRGRPRKDQSAATAEAESAPVVLKHSERLELLCACARAGLDDEIAARYLALASEEG